MYARGLFHYLLQDGSQLGLVLGCTSLSFQPKEQLRFPVWLEGQQVDDAVLQGLLGQRVCTAIPPVVGWLLVEVTVRDGQRSWPLLVLDAFT